MRSTTRAFTVIELIIIIAVISLLAMIAVPNFLEAQVRSKISRAQADMRVLAEVISRRVDVAHLTTAFYAMAHPRLPAVLDSLASRRHFDTIIVQPHLLFEGRLFQAIRRQTDEAAQRHPRVEWIHSDYLGPDPLGAEAIAARAGLS